MVKTTVCLLCPLRTTGWCNLTLDGCGTGGWGIGVKMEVYRKILFPWISYVMLMLMPIMSLNLCYSSELF